MRRIRPAWPQLNGAQLSQVGKPPAHAELVVILFDARGLIIDIERGRQVAGEDAECAIFVGAQAAVLSRLRVCD